MRKTTVGLSYAIKSLAITESPVVYPSVETELGAGEPMDPDIHLQPRRPAPSLDTLLRCRELGERGVRSRNTSKALQDAVERQDLRGLRPVRHLTSVPTIQHLVKNYVFDTLRPVKYQDEFSKDVSTVSWSPNGNMFAAGAVCESDPQSQQYNNPRNLLIGNKNEVRELPEHHVARPVVKSGVNALQSMRECLDPRLFMTVQQVAFSPNSDRLYSAAVDGCVNAYKIRNQNNLESTDSIKLMYKIPHKAAVDFLSISSTGILATGCRYSGRDSIRIVRSRKKGYEQLTTLSPNKITGLATYPSALRWGTGSQFKYLLAGFSCEKEQRYEEDISRDVQGETCLWDVETGARIPMGRSGGAVFDVTWNPVLNCRTAFATATVPNARVNKGTQSVVRLYAPGQGGARASYNMELECPAYDINDVIYCPYDENLVAVGSTDGKAFVWDCRYVDRHQSPQRVLTHGECLSVIPHTKYRWEADTGIRFLSWGENRTRLYTGSSDGVVKCWNPYAADEDMHIKDVASFNSAVMSGSFSPDHAKLLIGTENCRLNLLTVDNQDEAEISMPSLSRFTMHRAFMPANSKEDESVRLQPFLDSGELSLRRMGSLPVRQVVQGPNYTAPGIPTCESHVKRAEAAQAGTSPLKAATLLQEADEVDAEARRERPILRKQAAEFQDALAASLRLSRQQEEQCHLDCAYKPTEDQGYYTLKGDDKHSRSRIPSLLRTERPPATLHAALADSSILQARALRAQLTSPLEAAVLRKQADYLQAFRYVCKECGVLSRTSMCEKCDFKCFRCGNRARVSPRVRVVECEMCGLAWRADVLGYELVREEHREKTKKDVIEVDPVDKEMKKMRDEEMSFYVNSANWGAE
ncbi:hypothetical protein H2203_006580 [Taxawa tesnikishii (nom. ined.)]|nr:hypothetical protein H2203_006580 [Dothideales sp. JES 119]